MLRFFVTYPNKRIRIVAKNNTATFRYHNATKSSWARVLKLIRSKNVRTYFTNKAVEHWEYSPSGW